MDTCANCGDRIGKLETPFSWKDQTVCAACHAKLKQAAVLHDDVIPYATPSNRRTTLPWAFGIAAAVLLFVFICGMFGIFTLKLSSSSPPVSTPASTPPYATTAPADSGPPDPAR
jgi:hypothetical protein